jgi:hypothetical protein
LVTVRYPFHPLVGKELRWIKFRAGPPAIYEIDLLDSRLFLPAWMTQAWSADVKVVDSPQIEARKLLELADIAQNFLAALKESSCNPSEAQFQEEHDDDKVRSANAAVGDLPSVSGSIRTPGGDHAQSGQPAACGSRRRARKRGGGK